MSESIFKNNPDLLGKLEGLQRERRDYLEVFTERDFKGTSQKFFPGGKDASYDLAELAKGVGGDTISSLRLPNDGGGYGYGYTVVLYEHPGHKGASKSFRGDADYVGDELNDKTSSIKIYNMMP